MLKNGYPLEVLNEKFFERYKKLISNQQKTNSKQKSKLQIIFTIKNTLQQKIFQHLKIKLRKNLNNIIYKIYYIQCNKKYIGQTGRFLHNRLLEHARSVKNKENKTGLAEHAITYKHSFHFKNTKIIDIENNLKKRLNLEMIHIQKENSTINYKTDIENLRAIYNNIIKSIKE